VGGNKKAINKLIGNFQRTIRRNKEPQINAMKKNIEAADSQGKLRDLFKKVKVTGEFTPRVGCIKYDMNKSITEIIEIKHK